MNPHSFTNYWKVLAIYLIPFGGGIPSGVLLAKEKNIGWPIMMMLYFISDLILAVIFEPLLRLFIKYAKRSPKYDQIRMVVQMTIQRMIDFYGSDNGVFALIMIAFGADPMSGRAIAMAAGHGVLAGWAIAIAGDMLYFLLLMVSTLWLNSILGDGKTTVIVILVLMVIIPHFMRQIRKKDSPK
jgi:hypothetical protein